MNNTQYHLKFKNINSKTIDLVRTTIKKGLFKSYNTTEFKQDLILELHKNLCEVYNLPENKIIFDSGLHSNFNILTQNITLENNSLVTYLHEFKHYHEVYTTNHTTENSVRGWSISLFYLSTPKLFKNSIEKGLIIHQKKIATPKLTTENFRVEVEKIGVINNIFGLLTKLERSKNLNIENKKDFEKINSLLLKIELNIKEGLD